MPLLCTNPMRNNAKYKKSYINLNVPQNVVCVTAIEMGEKKNNNVQQ